MRKISMSGVGGMLSEAFYKQFKTDYILKCTDIDVNEDWLTYLDFRDEDAYRKEVIDFNPDYLFHIGALIDLEYCDLHETEAYESNTKPVEYAVKIANDLKIPLLYISTAGIFRGEKDVYGETDTCFNHAYPAILSMFFIGSYFVIMRNTSVTQMAALSQNPFRAIHWFPTQ